MTIPLVRFDEGGNTAGKGIIRIAGVVDVTGKVDTQGFSETWEASSCNNMDGRMVVMMVPWELKLRNFNTLSWMLKRMLPLPALLFSPVMASTTKKLKQVHETRELLDNYLGENLSFIQRSARCAQCYEWGMARRWKAVLEI